MLLEFCARAFVKDVVEMKVTIVWLENRERELRIGNVGTVFPWSIGKRKGKRNKK